MKKHHIDYTHFYLFLEDEILAILIASVEIT